MESFEKEHVSSEEPSREENLKEWNHVQYELWLKLVSQDYVLRNDAVTFEEFGKFFFDFCRKHDRFPEDKEELLTSFVRDKLGYYD